MCTSTLTLLYTVAELAVGLLGVMCKGAPDARIVHARQHEHLWVFLLANYALLGLVHSNGLYTPGLNALENITRSSQEVRQIVVAVVGDLTDQELQLVFVFKHPTTAHWSVSVCAIQVFNFW